MLVDYAIPGNDDSIKSISAVIKHVTKLISDTILLKISDSKVILLKINLYRKLNEFSKNS